MSSLDSSDLFPPAFIELDPERMLPVRSQTTIDNNRDLFNEVFVGAETKKSVVKYLTKPGDFRLYYKMSTTKIVLYLPLMIAYKASDGKIYNYPVKRSEHKNWHVLASGRTICSFSSLSALIRYHKIYSYINPKTGQIDTFPIDAESHDEYPSDG
jgi:hypothetical protein